MANLGPSEKLLLGKGKRGRLVGRNLAVLIAKSFLKAVRSINATVQSKITVKNSRCVCCSSWPSAAQSLCYVIAQKKNATAIVTSCRKF